MEEKSNLEPENEPQEKEMCHGHYHVHIFRFHILHVEACSCLWIFWIFTLGLMDLPCESQTYHLHPNKTQAVPRRRETSGLFGQVGPLAECFIIGAIKAFGDGSLISLIQKGLNFRFNTSSLGIRWRTPKVTFRFFWFLSYLAPALF